MCGIVGYVGNNDAAPVLLHGLAKLEYRGYDSAGICVRQNNLEPVIVKAEGKLKNLIDKTDSYSIYGLPVILYNNNEKDPALMKLKVGNDGKIDILETRKWSKDENGNTVISKIEKGVEIPINNEDSNKSIPGYTILNMDD